MRYSTDNKHRYSLLQAFESLKIPEIVMSAEAEQVEMQDANENSVSWPGIALENSRLPAKLDLCCAQGGTQS